MEGKKAYLVVGLAYGDEGKGSIVDYLVREKEAGLVVRFNGGPQAAHHVATADNRIHCFAQFGAGTLVPGTRTFLSEYMLLEPFAFLKEWHALRAIGVNDAWERMVIDERCLVITPYHSHLNRLRERLRGRERHGSCGHGVGEAYLDSVQSEHFCIRVRDAASPQNLRAKVRAIRALKIEQAEQLVAERKTDLDVEKEFDALVEDWSVDDLCKAYSSFFGREGIRIVSETQVNELFRSEQSVVFEGAQGVLLDMDHGVFPYVTPSKTTFVNADNLLDRFAPEYQRERVGVVRGYMTRHGAGPFITEQPALMDILRDENNDFGPWQGDFRIGWFDAVSIRYAIRICGGIDSLAITNLDRLGTLKYAQLCTKHRESENGKLAAEYRSVSCDPRHSALVDAILEEIEFKQGTLFLSFGPTADDKFEVHKRRDAALQTELWAKTFS